MNKAMENLKVGATETKWDRAVVVPSGAGQSLSIADCKIAVLDVGQTAEVMIQEAEQNRRLMRVGRKMNGYSAQPKQAPHWHRFTKGRF